MQLRNTWEIVQWDKALALHATAQHWIQVLHLILPEVILNIESGVSSEHCWMYPPKQKTSECHEVILSSWGGTRDIFYGFMLAWQVLPLSIPCAPLLNNLIWMRQMTAHFPKYLTSNL